MPLSSKKFTRKLKKIENKNFPSFHVVCLNLTDISWLFILSAGLMFLECSAKTYVFPGFTNFLTYVLVSTLV